jgi:ABC-type amino acid transport system permease subunit
MRFPVSVLAAGYVNLMRSVPLLLVIFWFAGWGGRIRTSASQKSWPCQRSRAATGLNKTISMRSIILQ